MHQAGLHKQLKLLSEQYYKASLDDYESVLAIIETLLQDQLTQVNQLIALKKTLQIGSQTIEVTYIEKDGKITIGNAWVVR